MRPKSHMPSLEQHGWTRLLAFGFGRDTEKSGGWLQHVGITLITAIFLLEQEYFITFNLEPGTNYTCVVRLTINLPLLTADTYLCIYFVSHTLVFPESKPKEFVKRL